MLKIGHRALELLAALARRDAADDLRAVLHHLLRVERAVAPGDALHDQRRVVVDEDAHAAFPPFASATAFFTASSMSDDAVKPFSCRIFTAISSFVPVSRMTIGTLSGFCFVAVTMPFATSSVRVMPPKMLNRIDLHARIGGDDAERVDDLLRIRRAADVEEVGRLAAVVLHEVHRRHREAGAVHDAADVAVELDEREVRVARLAPRSAPRPLSSRSAARSAWRSSSLSSIDDLRVERERRRPPA